MCGVVVVVLYFATLTTLSARDRATDSTHICLFLLGVYMLFVGNGVWVICAVLNPWTVHAGAFVLCCSLA